MDETSQTPPLPLDYICVLDFEANCLKKGKPTPQEIIEFPVLLVNASTGDVEDTFHRYILPDVHPKISEFCTELTGITRELLQQRGVSLEQALQEHETWMKQHNLCPAWLATSSTKDQRTCLYLTAGDWDFQTCLPRQLGYHGRKPPTFAERWINLKPTFMQVFAIQTKKGLSMVRMLEMLGLELLGRHHSGIDDCRNIARIVQEMIRSAGWKPTSESWTTKNLSGGD